MNEDLQKYIQQARQAGMEDGAIKQALLSTSYSIQDIGEAFSNIGAEGNVMESMLNKKPMFPETEKRPVRSKSKFGRIAKIFAIILLILAALIGSYFALGKYFPQYAKYVQPYVGPVLDPVVEFINSVTSNIPFIGGAPYSPDDILKAFEKTVLIDSARYNATFYIETQDKNSNSKPLVIKIPQGEVPADLKKGVVIYDYSPLSGIKSGELNKGNVIIVELNELKPAMDAKATDKAKIQLASSILAKLGQFYSQNQRDPAKLAELNTVGTSPSTYGYEQWGPLEGKYYTYTAAPDLKSFKLTITLESAGSVEGLKKTIESLKKISYYGNEFKEGSIVFEGNRVIFNERSISFAYNLTYGYGNESVAEQMAAFFSDDSYGGYLSFIPGSFKLNLNVGGIMQSKDSKSFYIQLGGKADFEDLVVEADFEFTNVDNESFFKINKFPSVFMDVSKVREEWIKLPVASKSSGSVYSEADYYSSFGSSIQEGITEYREKSDRNFEQLRKVASIAEQEKIIIAEGSPVKEKVGDRNAYKYLVTIDENKLASFYEKSAAALKEYGADALIQEDELTKLFFNSDGLREIIKYLKDVSDFNVWVDTSGYIIKSRYDLKYIPYVASDSRTPSNKQFYISSSLELSDINQDLGVERPDSFIEWKDALSKLFGVTGSQIDNAQAKARDAKRIADISQLRTAAELYFDDHGGTYPTALNIANLDQYFSSADVPKDPSTGLPYNYAYYPTIRPTGYHIWTELEINNAPALNGDADINSDKSGWIGAKIDASKEGSEVCTAAYNNGTSRDCIYDLGTLSTSSQGTGSSNLLGNLLLYLQKAEESTSR